MQQNSNVIKISRYDSIKFTFRSYILGRSIFISDLFIFVYLKSDEKKKQFVKKQRPNDIFDSTFEFYLILR